MNSSSARPILRVLIADDEALARERVRTLLSREAGIDIVGECSDGDATLDAIRKQHPELVFLDIQMPGRSGMEVLQAFSSARDAAPAVIFTTAFDEYAVKAFEVHALDYLLKPFKPARFREALERARVQLACKQASAGGADVSHHERILALLNEYRAVSAQPSAGEVQGVGRIVVRDGDRIRFVVADDITWIEASGNYAILHTVVGEKHIIRETLLSLENQLNARRFFRLSRSALVNLEHVREAQPTFDGEHIVVLKTGARVPMTRGLRDLQERLKFL